MGVVIFLIIICVWLSSRKPTSLTSTPIVETDCLVKPNTQKVFEALYIYDNLHLTSADVAKITRLEKRTVDGIFTSAIQRKGFGVRTPVEIELEDGTYKAVKFLSLTPAGKRFVEEIL